MNNKTEMYFTSEKLTNHALNIGQAGKLNKASAEVLLNIINNPAEPTEAMKELMATDFSQLKHN